MSEYPVSISQLNDFIFCPASIYFHSLEDETDKLSFQTEAQINGTAAHEKSDFGEYSTKKDILQGIPVFSEKYNIFGKIDVFDAEKGILTERKKKIKTVYDGYIFQLYAQYFSLCEMGYNVTSIRLFSMDDNKIYEIKLPGEDKEMNDKFNNLLSELDNFVLDDFKQQNREKCLNCIYEPLCSFSTLKG